MWEIDGYVAGSELGRDSAGVVVRATDSMTGMDVAIRYLAPELAGSQEFMAGLQTDTDRLAAVEHANVGQVYELAEKDSFAALVTELVDGPTLGSLLGRGPLPADAAVHVAAGALGGLVALHDLGVLHRAVRPTASG